MIVPEVSTVTSMTNDAIDHIIKTGMMEQVEREAARCGKGFREYVFDVIEEQLILKLNK